jgi:Pilus formation protein N terminal region
MTLRRTLLLAFLIAASVQANAAPAEAPQAFDVRIDEAKLIRLDRDAAQVIVGNPSIADVAAQGSRLLVVTGKSFGSTNVIALDGQGREILSAQLGVAPNDTRLVTVYRGALRTSLHCAPDCQRMLAIGDDKTQFEQLAEAVAKKFGVANSAIGGQQ